MTFSFSFQKVVQDSPVISDEVKRVLLAQEAAIPEAAKRDLIKTILGYEDKVYTAAREFIWTNPAKTVA